ncbi:MAG: binding-protein-dependent transport system inner rane component [Firmicutes bacterium]|nr:binding-protein-dependent transport system inner rane component [Bacillota bacterium]
MPCMPSRPSSVSGLSRYVSKRLLTTLFMPVAAAFIVFGMMRLLPGDPARIVAGIYATEPEVAHIRAQLGLDQPVPVQFVRFLERLAHGDAGTSIRTSQPVLQEIGARLPATLQLAVISTVLASIVGVVVGVVCARRPNSLLDYLFSFGSLVGVSMPVYWLGLLLIILFAVRLQWLPAAGNDLPGSIILPAVTAAAFSIALVARMTRASMLEVLQQDYIRTVRAKGLSPASVIYKHALRNAAIPVLTVIGLQFGTFLGGSVLIESVFAWPGMGLLLLDSIFARDYPVVQGIVLIYAVLVILVNLAVDLLYAFLDPRIRYD